MVRPAWEVKIVRLGRWWLSVAYSLASLLATVGHDHARQADATFLDSAGDCDEARPHLGDHGVDGSPASPTECPSCHFRAQHPLAELAPRPVPGPGLAIPPEADAPSTLPGSPLRTRCRAPPRA